MKRAFSLQSEKMEIVLHMQEAEMMCKRLLSNSTVQSVFN